MFYCRTIPRAVIITMLSVIVLYVLTNVSLLAVLGAEGIRQSHAVAMVTDALLCLSGKGSFKSTGLTSLVLMSTPK